MIGKKYEVDYLVPISMRITAAGAQDDYEMRTLFGYGSVLLILIGLLFITMIQKSRQRKPLAANMLQFIKYVICNK